MAETQKALGELKALITKLPVLASLEPSETLLLYVAATTQVISAALVVEWEKLRHIYKVKGRYPASARSSPTVRPTTISCKRYFMPFAL
jgi:hypothetical protein